MLADLDPRFIKKLGIRVEQDVAKILQPFAGRFHVCIGRDPVLRDLSYFFAIFQILNHP